MGDQILLRRCNAHSFLLHERLRYKDKDHFKSWNLTDVLEKHNILLKSHCYLTLI